MFEWIFIFFKGVVAVVAGGLAVIGVGSPVVQNDTTSTTTPETVEVQESAISDEVEQLRQELEKERAARFQLEKGNLISEKARVEAENAKLQSEIDLLKSESIEENAVIQSSEAELLGKQKVEYHEFLIALSIASNELSIARGYIDSSTDSINMSDDRNCVSYSDKAIESLDRINPLITKIKIPALPYSLTMTDLIKNFQQTVDLYKQSMTARKGWCNYSLQGRNYNELFRLMDEDFEFYDRAVVVYSVEFVANLEKLQDQANEHFN